ncbi:MAG: effector binding domain-containing protein [Leptotrichiaceae bacterium]|nr:effector binding domain-containing protein [Leptotrichiaceae bacterium]
MKEFVFIILDGFADWETAFLSAALNGGEFPTGYSVKYASTDREIKTSVGGLKVLPDITIDEISDSVSGIVLIGSYNWRKLDNKTSEKIITLVRKFKNQGKVVGAICDAARYAAVNGLLNDCCHTVNDFEEIKNGEKYTNHHNFVYTDINSVIDGKMVTATGTGEIHFAANVMRALGDIPEKSINFFYDMHMFGYPKAMENFNRTDGINHEIMEIKGKTVIGIQERIKDDNDTMFEKIAALWDRMYKEKRIAENRGRINGNSIAVYYNYSMDYGLEYDNLIGCEISDENLEIYKNIIKLDIPSGKYAKFKIFGNPKKVVGEFWQNLGDYLNSFNLERTFVYDFEEYIEGGNFENAEIHVYIGIKDN